MDSSGDMLLGTINGYVIKYDPVKKLSLIEKVSRDINQMTYHDPETLLLATSGGLLIR